MSRTISIAPVRKSIRVKSTPEQAFEVFASRMSRWWPATHATLQSPLRDMILEGKKGGRWYQVGEDGSTCDVGHVIAWEPPQRLLLAWQLDPSWQFNPQLLTEVEVTFSPEDGGFTRVDLEHRHLERMGDKAETVRTSIDSPGGWGAILESYRQTAEA
jgi:uncharacterized protein YndB with AHSA1/START domain